MEMGRPRKYKKDMPPGLYCYPGRKCYIRFGGMSPLDLGTAIKEEALVLYWEFRRAYDAEKLHTKVATIAAKIESAAKGTDAVTVIEYSKAWRANRLPILLKENGLPLSDKTRGDYNRMLSNQLEKHPPFETLMLNNISVRDCRTFLAQWISSPSFYNYMKSLVSRLLQSAIDDGLLDTNPTREIKRRATKKRETYISDEAYVAITSQMGEREAWACDLLYLISHNPSTVLGLTESNIKDGLIKFTRKKTNVDMEIEEDDQILHVIDWFRSKKREDGIVSPYIVVYGKNSKRRLIGKPLSVGYLSRKFSEAVIKAGFKKGEYTLRDIRPKGLTDEWVIAGESDKGGHLTEEMKRYYRRVRLPFRAKNNLRLLR